MILVYNSCSQNHLLPYKFEMSASSCARIYVEYCATYDLEEGRLRRLVTARRRWNGFSSVETAYTQTTLFGAGGHLLRDVERPWLSMLVTDTQTSSVCFLQIFGKIARAEGHHLQSTHWHHHRLLLRLSLVRQSLSSRCLQIARQNCTS